MKGNFSHERHERTRKKTMERVENQESHYDRVAVFYFNDSRKLVHCYVKAGG